MSVWAETAHFQLPTPRGQWRAISLAQRGVGTCCEGRMGSYRRLVLEYPRSKEIACGWAGHLRYWQVFRVRTEQGMGCV